MILIAHRGNITGPSPEQENRPEYIYAALRQGYDVEIDVWYGTDGKFMLGHDNPDYSFPFELLENWYSKLWIHCKNYMALEKLVEIDKGGHRLNYFWHEEDFATLTSKGFIWSIHPVNHGILVMPEVTQRKYTQFTKGICSDYVGEYA